MSKWKPVVLDSHALFNDIEGLVGIEVLDDDEAKVISRKINLKRKIGPATDNPPGKHVKIEKTAQNANKVSANKKGKVGKKLVENGAVQGKEKTKKKQKKKGKQKNKITIEESPKLISDDEAEDVDSDVEKAACKIRGEAFLEKMDAWKPFGLRKEILRALHDKGFLSPTPIQQKCVLAAMTSKKSDIVGAAETGSGKTYAFGIPIIQAILASKNDSVDHEDDDVASGDEELDGEEIPDRLKAIVVTPTRELAVQVKAHLTDLCKYTEIRPALVVGGLAKEKQERILSKGPEIIVGTPGRLWEIFSEGNAHLSALPRVKMLVVDEADRMLEAQHFAELGQMLERMNDDPEISNQRRNFVFSATLTFVHDPPSYHKGKKKKNNPKQKLTDLLGRIGVKNKLVYDLSQSKLTPEALREWKISCQFEEKDYYLVHFLQSNPGRAIIFCNSIGCVRRLANLLGILKFSPLPLHANMEQKQRLRNLEKFRDNKDGLLLATDVAARGLDIPQVSHVVHYQVPRTAESYIHRSGRTARQQSSGAALLLVSVEENKMYIKLMKSLKRAMGVEDLDVPLEELSNVKKLVHIARDLDQATLALKKASSTEKWYDKAIKDMDILVDDDERPEKTTDRALGKLKKAVAAKEKELNGLLATPNLPRGFSGLFPDMNKQKQPKKKAKNVL